MLFDNPEVDKKFREAINTLADITGNDTELTVLITFIRTFFEVKRKRSEERRNKVIKLKPVDD